MTLATTRVATGTGTPKCHLSVVGSHATLVQGDRAAKKREKINSGKKNETRFHGSDGNQGKVRTNSDVFDRCETKCFRMMDSINVLDISVQ